MKLLFSQGGVSKVSDASGSVTRSKRQFDNWPGSYSDQNRHEWQLILISQFCATYSTAAMKWKARVLLEDELFITLLHSLRASATSICLAVLHCVYDCSIGGFRRSGFYKISLWEQLPSCFCYCGLTAVINILHWLMKKLMMI